MKKEETKILLIEDDQNLGGITTDYLTAKGCLLYTSDAADD